MDSKLLGLMLQGDAKIAQEVATVKENLSKNYLTSEEVKKIINEDLDESGDNDNEPISWNDVTDKPFYEGLIPKIYVPETELVVGSDVVTIPRGDLEFALGTYHVVFDGVDEEFSMMQIGDPAKYFALGDASIALNTIGSSDPYAVWMDCTSGEFDDYIYLKLKDNSAAHTISVYRLEEGVKQLDEKFLPDHSHETSWNDLEDKPFYEEEEKEVLWTGTQAPNTQMVYECEYIPEVGEAVYVVTDGISVMYIVEDLTDAGYAGSIGFRTSDVNISWTLNTGNITVYNKASSGTITEIYRMVPVIHTLDEKFIPDSVKNAAVSPIVEVVKEETVANVTITDAKGVKTFSINDGAKGDKGDKGDPGYTPVKGTDYYAEADKIEMVNLVLAALPTWEGGSY